MVKQRYADIFRGEELSKISRWYRYTLLLEDVVEKVLEDLGIERDIAIEVQSLDEVLKIFEMSGDLKKLVVYLGTRCSNDFVENVDGVTIGIVCRENARANLDRLYRKLIESALDISFRYLYSRIYESVEYIFILLSDGNALVMQGTEKSVSFPSNIEIIFTAHTHPHTHYAVFSKHDLLSGIDIISKRGLGFCVYSLSDHLCIYRKGMLTIDDYEDLIRIANSYEYVDRYILKERSFRNIDVL